MLQQVRMLETRPGSEDGRTVKYYIKGRTYMLSDFLLESFIAMGVVELCASNEEDEYGYEHAPAQSPEDRMLRPDKRGPGRPKNNEKY